MWDCPERKRKEAAGEGRFFSRLAPVDCPAIFEGLFVVIVGSQLGSDAGARGDEARAEDHENKGSGYGEIMHEVGSSRAIEMCVADRLDPYSLGAPCDSFRMPRGWLGEHASEGDRLRTVGAGLGTARVGGYGESYRLPGTSL